MIDTVNVPRGLLRRVLKAMDVDCSDLVRHFLSVELRALLDALAEPAPVQDERNHVGNSSFESWYADYDPSGKGDKQRARDAYAAGMGDPVYLPAPVQEPETVSVYGVKSNGEVFDTGVKAPMPPRMKAKEMVREMFGPWEEDDGSDSDLCFAACEQFFEWLISQGWTAPQAQQPAPVREPLKVWCETCDGTGTVYQEHQDGCWVGGYHACPDCGGKGHVFASPQAQQEKS